jgi:ribosomal protein S18 acetylase RimI-like enzyme
MDVRTATDADREAIEDVTKRSLSASYSLGPTTIGNAAEEWYGPDAYAEKLADDHVILLVAETDGVVGFSESYRVAGRGQGELLWLHVHPDHRDQGIGSELYERTRERLLEAGVQYLRSRVLADNRSGATFYETRGFERIGQDRFEIDGERYEEYVYLLPDVETDGAGT